MTEKDEFIKRIEQVNEEKKRRQRVSSEAFHQFRAASDKLLADIVEWMEGVPGKCHLFEHQMKEYSDLDYTVTALDINLDSHTIRICPTGFSLSMSLNMTITGRDLLPETITYVIAQPVDKLAGQSWTIQKMGLFLGENRSVHVPKKVKLTEHEFFAILGETMLNKV